MYFCVAFGFVKTQTTHTYVYRGDCCSDYRVRCDNSLRKVMHYTKQKEHANTLILLQHHKYSSLSKHAYLFLINAIPTWTKVRTPTSNHCISDAMGSPVCWNKYWPFQTVRSLIIVVVIKCFQDDKHRSNHILPQKHSQDSQQIIKLVTCVGLDHTLLCRVCRVRRNRLAYDFMHGLFNKLYLGIVGFRVRAKQVQTV